MEQPISARMMDVVCPGDEIRVGRLSGAIIRFYEDGRSFTLYETSRLQIRESESGNRLIDLIRGSIYVSWKYLLRTVSGSATRLEINTPVVNGRVTGTEFYVRVYEDRTYFDVVEGRVQLSNEHGSLVLTDDQAAVTIAGRAPQIQIPVRPRDAVQWTIYYPPVLSPWSDLPPPGTPHASLYRQSLEALLGNDPSMSYDLLQQIPEGDRDAKFYSYRAGISLAGGSPEEARKDLERTMSLSPESSEAYSLLAVIAVALNNTEQALQDGRKAVELNPNSSTARIALSYGLQSNLELEEARAVLLQAVNAQPEDALAWARLAEIQLSLGNLDKAIEAAQTAVAKRPDLGYAHMILGFARLSQIKISQAFASFEKAISLDPKNPMAFLGLGLARIRKGDLEEGRRDIATAVALDPGNSLTRSYLGKAYFEEKRDTLAAEQLARAKKLDPLDPTPFFYDAIRKQTVNRPVEALRDLQKSIELNDNRAVYRSRLLMDQDLAARSASLARIYRDLNFEQLALVEGWNSLNTDPASHSAHRFLADSYSSQPRHEIARVSELLQSQLLQPLNIVPIQPQLSETDLFIISGAGPSEAAFNEYNPLFARNRLAAQANVVVGENNLFGNDFVFSGIQDRVSFSVGQFHYNDDGFRENNDQRQNIYNAFVQGSITHKTSVQAEFKHTDRKYGDLGIRFDPENFNSILRNDVGINSIRFGARHDFTPNMKVIASVISQRGDYSTKTTIPVGDIVSSLNDNNYIVEGQYLFRSERFKLVGGAGHYDADGETLFQMPGFESKDKLDEGQRNTYVYTQTNLFKTLDITVGVSYDSFHGYPSNIRQTNPKLGLTWKPFRNTTLRVAGFRTLKRALVANQTIEPTQVAGFNQFFDDDNGADTRRFGIGLDHKFTPNLFAGVEISRRELRLVTPVWPENTLEHYKWMERVGRAYIYWAPHPWFAGTLDYQLERFEKFYPPDTIVVDEEVRLKTHRLPLGVNFYHPSGFNAGFKVTYVEQEGTYYNFMQMEVIGKDDFWVTDANVEYRFPQRYGLISFGVKNLFDTKLRFQDTDPGNPSIYPERLVFGRCTLAF